MRNPVYRLSFTCFIVFVSSAMSVSAFQGNIYTFEGDSFSEIIVGSKESIVLENLQQIFPNQYLLEIYPFLTSIEKRSLSTRNKKRILEFQSDKKYIRFSVECECSVRIFHISSKILLIKIVDIADVGSLKNDSGASLHDKAYSAVFPFLQHRFAGSLVSEFHWELFRQYSSKAIEDNTIVDSMTYSNRGVFQAIKQSRLTPYSNYADEFCAEFRHFWKDLGAKRDSLFSGGVSGDARAQKNSESDVTENHVYKEVLASLVTNGLIEEARSFSSESHMADDALDVAKYSIGLIDDDGDLWPSLQVLNCGSTHSLLKALGVHGESSVLDDRTHLALWQEFMSLPLGLRLRLKSQMVRMMSHSTSGGQVFLQHSMTNNELSNPELRVADVRSTYDVGSKSASDASAAVYIEKRGTDKAELEWSEVFNMYLSDERYFDALRHIALQDFWGSEDRKSAISDLMNAIVITNDALTAIEVLGLLQPNLAEYPDETTALTEMLARNGFFEYARELSNTANGVVGVAPVASGANPFSRDGDTINDTSQGGQSLTSTDAAFPSETTSADFGEGAGSKVDVPVSVSQAQQYVLGSQNTRTEILSTLGDR